MAKTLHTVVEDAGLFAAVDSAFIQCCRKASDHPTSELNSSLMTCHLKRVGELLDIKKSIEY